METMTIGEVARLAGLEPSTLRYYESIGLLPAPRRISGRRCYTAEVLPILAVIQLAKEANFTLHEIDMLLHGFSEDMTPSERWKTLARRKLEEVNAIIANALEMKRLLEEALECESLQVELDSAIWPRRSATSSKT